MPLCPKCLMQGIMSDMCKVAFEFPEFGRRVQNAVNFTARECVRCHYQAPLEGWDMWYKRKKPTRRQWDILEERTQGPQLVF